MRGKSVLRAVVAAAIASLGAWAAVGCQVALKADAQSDIHCDLPDGTPCPNSATLVCLGGLCRTPPPCVPKPEVCNGVDDDCDGNPDEGFDQDADGYKVCGNFDESLRPLPNTTDCNDNDPTIHPGVVELCNGVDDNCNGRVDEEPNDCTIKNQECWSDKKLCVDKGDCRLHGCTDGGCDSATGKCTGTDCVKVGCPTGFTCDAKSHACFKTVNIGDPCDATVVCPDGSHCLDSFVRGKICTVSCCAAGDCPNGFVCHAPSPPNGASVCISATEAGLTLGSKAAHETCSTGRDCRSGQCTSNKCIDSCCGTIDCGSGGSCVLKSADGLFLCRDAPGTGGYGASCAANSDCKSGACIDLGFGSGFCSQRCCSSTDCPDKRDRCELFKSGSNPAEVCAPFAFFAGTGTKRGGDSCGANGDCRSDRCGSDGHCDDFCCHDGDCSGGWICKPKFDGTFYPLRCVDPNL